MSAHIRWPLPFWRDRVGVSSATHREAYLGGRFGEPNETKLGDLRRFVASLDQWPDGAMSRSRPVPCYASSSSRLPTRW